jgi:hypothetical protein
MAITQQSSGKKLKELIKDPSLEEIVNVIHEYRSTLKVKEDHLERLLFLATNGIDQCHANRTYIPILSKLFEMLTDNNIKMYLPYVIEDSDIAEAGYMISRLIRFFHIVFNDEYLQATMAAYEVKHHNEDGLGVLDIYRTYQTKLNNIQ